MTCTDKIILRAKLYFHSVNKYLQIVNKFI